MSTDIGSPETIANVSRSQLRLAPTAFHPMNTLALNSIAVTLLFLALANAAATLEKSRWAIGNAYLIGVLLCLGGLSLLNSVRLWPGRMNTVFSNYTRFVFTALLFWCVVTIVRVDWFDQLELKQAFGGRYFAWAWVVPVSMVLGSDVRIWRQALRFGALLGALGCIILIAGWVPLSIHTDFGFTELCPIALLFWHYFPKKRTRRIVLLAALICTFLPVLSVSRSRIFGAGLLILFASYIQFFRRQIWRLRTRVCLTAGFSVAFIAIAFFASVDRVPFVGDTINAGIGDFKGNLFENTRISAKGDWLYLEFLRDVRGLDFVIGRGSRGTYTVDRGSRDNPVDIREREHIEFGYFQVILHGGVVMLIMILSLSIPAIYLGMFRSRNWFTRGCAFIVLGRLLEMVPFGPPVAKVRYVLFWMAIGACLTWKIRAMSDADIFKIFAARCALRPEKKR